MSDTDKPSKPKKKAKDKPKPSKDEIAALRAELRKCEDRVAKLEEMRGKLQTKLADPALYDEDKAGDLEVWNRKYAEVQDGLIRAEGMWEAAQDKLDRAEARL